MTDEERRAKRREGKRKYKLTHPEEHRAARRRYYSRHKQKMWQRAAAWKEAHPEATHRHYERSQAKKWAGGVVVPLEQYKLLRKAKAAERAAERDRQRADNLANRAQQKMERAAEARARRLEQYRQQSRRYRRLYADRKREQDRRYRAANPAKVRVYNKRGKERARLNGSLQLSIARSSRQQAAKHRRLTAAIQVLRERGILPPIRWGATTDRGAALAFARELGLL